MSADDRGIADVSEALINKSSTHVREGGPLTRVGIQLRPWDYSRHHDGVRTNQPYSAPPERIFSFHDRNFGAPWAQGCDQANVRRSRAGKGELIEGRLSAPLHGKTQ